MATSVKDLARICGAQLLGGSPDAPIHSAANFDEAQSGQITFVGAAKYAAKLKTTVAIAVIVAKGTAPAAVSSKTCLLVAEDLEMAFIACLHHLYPEKPNPGKISPGTGRCQRDRWRRNLCGAFVRIGARPRLARIARCTPAATLATMHARRWLCALSERGALPRREARQ